MNIVEAYIKFNSQLIILISGFSGSGKTMLGRNIQRDFKLEFINLNDFYKEDYNEIVDLGYDIKVVDWDNPEAINWNKFNEKVDNTKNKGIVCVGFGFPEDKINFKPDFHIRLDIPKQKLLELRHKYLDENKDNKLNEYKDSRTETLIINKLSYPHYENIKFKSKYTYKFSLFDKDNINLEDIPTKMYDDVFDYLIQQIEKNIYKK